MIRMNFDVKLEPHYLEHIKEHGLISLVGALLNYGNELGLEGRKIYGVHFNEDGVVEIRTKKEEESGINTEST